MSGLAEEWASGRRKRPSGCVVERLEVRLVFSAPVDFDTDSLVPATIQDVVSDPGEDALPVATLQLPILTVLPANPITLGDTTLPQANPPATTLLGLAGSAPVIAVPFGGGITWGDPFTIAGGTSLDVPGLAPSNLADGILSSFIYVLPPGGTGGRTMPYTGNNIHLAFSDLPKPHITVTCDSGLQPGQYRIRGTFSQIAAASTPAGGFDFTFTAV